MDTLFFRQALAIVGILSSSACPPAGAADRAINAAVRETRDLLMWASGRLESDSAVTPVRGDMIRIVARIRRAGYEGDRAALRRHHEELAPLRRQNDARMAARVRYWQGYAMWQRSIDGFNDGRDRKELERDLQLALRHFEDALALDLRFVEAKIGAIACLQSLAYLNREIPSAIPAIVSRLKRLFEESQGEAPENPRLLWVLGGQQWYQSTAIGERQDLAISTYARGLRLARERKAPAKDTVEPSWGEPELLMSLAWANLHRTPPDVRAAEQYAREALALVPYWRYIRNTLLPQIDSAGRKQPVEVRIMALKRTASAEPDDRPVRTISRNATDR